MALGDILSLFWLLRERRTARRREDLKGRIVAAMRRVQPGRPTQTPVSAEQLSQMLDVSVAELVTALGELERERRVFYDSLSGMYALQPTPWSYPALRPRGL